MEKEIKKMNDELGKLDSYRLSDVYQYATDIDDFKSDFTEEIRKNPQSSIISFLIRNAYIDESYQDYLNHFYENTITVEEKEYLRNVVSGRDGNYDISLTNTNEIVNRLAIKDYRYSYVLNYNLFDYLLNSRKENDNESLAQVFKQEGVLDFLINFYNTLDRATSGQGVIYKKETIKLFFKKWLEHNVSLFNEYLEIKNGGYAAPNKNSLILSLMNLVDLSDCTKETKEQLAKYLEIRQEILLNTNDYNYGQFNANLSNVNLKIKDFTFIYQGYEKNLLNYIYQNRLYEICESNVLFFMEQYSDMGTELSDVKHKNYEIMTSQKGLKPLLDYCQSSDEEFLKYILMYITLSEGEMRDKPEYIEHLLNNDVVFNHQVPQEKLESDESDESGNDENIKKVTLSEEIISSIPNFYITYTQDKFNHLSVENREILVKNLVHTQKAEVNTEIVLEYFSQYKKDDNFLVDFINQNPNFEFDKAFYLRFNEEIQEQFEEYIIQKKTLQKNIRKKVLNATGDRYFEKFSEIGMNESELDRLTDDRLVEFNRLNLEFFRKEYPSSLANFIWNNIKDYLNDEKDIRDEKQLQELIDKYYLEMEDSTKIRMFLLDNHFNQVHFKELLNKNTYENAENEVQSKIQNLVKKYIREFIALDGNEISIPLYESILNANDVLLEHKKELFEKLISYSGSQIEVDKLILLGDYLDLLELPDIMQILKEQIDDGIYTEWEVALDQLNQNEGNGRNSNQEAEVSYSEFNEKLLDYLKKRKLISNKSKHENSVLKLYGFRKKQIEYSDEAEEKQ